MKQNYFLPAYLLIVSALACSLPGSIPAAPTINPLPPTPNLPFSSSPAPQASDVPPASASIRDEFDGKLAPGSGWTWLRQDSSAWSLTATPGWLRINLSTAGYLNGLPSNVLTTSAPQGDFDIRTSVKFSPSQNFEFAGLVVLFGEKSVLQAGRAYCDLGSCPGSGFYFDNLQNGSAVGGNFGMAGSSNTSQIRIVRQGNAYTAYYQTDGVNWVVIGSHTVAQQPVSIGLLAAQAPSAGSFAEFDYIEINQP
jgi:regulation of enolase protein 1 (concanavalin A-like superfamily)